MAQALVSSGWHLLDQNWRGGGGELDSVVCREGMLRFVEVKLRGETVDLDEVVTASKRLRLRGAARAWMRERNEAWGDIAFLIAFVDNEGHVEWTDDAF